MRAEAVGKLAYFLTHERDSIYKRPAFSELDIQTVDRFLLNDSIVILEEDTGRSVFRQEGLVQIMEIFLSDTVEISVKKSAVNQLSVMLQGV